MGNRREEPRSYCQIEKSIAYSVVPFIGFVDLLLQALVSLRVQEIAFDVVDALAHPVPELRVDGRGNVFWNFCGQHFPEAGGIKIVAGKAYDGKLFGQNVVLGQVTERGNQLALGEVAGGAENNHHTRRRGRVHVQMVEAHEREFLSSGAK